MSGETLTAIFIRKAKAGYSLTPLCLTFYDSAHDFRPEIRRAARVLKKKLMRHGHSQNRASGVNRQILLIDEQCLEGEERD